MYRQSLNRIISWQATFYNATARLRRPRVTAILCQGCGKWVKPRRCDPILLICNKCVADPAQNSYSYYVYRRAAAEQALAQRRAYQKEQRQWRRQSAAVRR